MVQAAGDADPRTAIAHDIFEENREWQTIIYKTTRAGATTSMLSEFMNQEQKFLCIVPTNRIAMETVISEAKNFTQLQNPQIIHVPANHNCMLNQELCKEYPDLKELPVLPLAGNCNKCDYFPDCSVTAILRNPNSDGIVLTYSKINALMLAAKSRPNAYAGRVIEEIRKTKVVLLDEIHELQFGKVTTLTAHDNINGYISIEKYIPMIRDYEYLRRVISSFSLVLSDPDIQNAIFEIHNETEDAEFFSHHIRKILPNPAPGIVEKEKEINVIVGTYNEIIELTKNREKYKLSMQDILDLYKILSIVLNHNIAIHGIREDGFAKVQLSIVDIAYNKLLASFVMSMQQEKNKIFLTSATIGSFDYGPLFKAGMRPKKAMFGENGDPLNTNSKMLILADSKRYHAKGKNSFYHKRQEIVSRVCSILQAYGSENCITVTLNKREAFKLEFALESVGVKHHVTYYKAPELMGVSAKQRVMIAVGLAKKPVNSYDVITNSVEESRVMLAEAEHCDTWQAWSRVKDPEGKENSLVFALGCTVEECENLTTYGFNRKVEIEPYERNQKKRVNVSIEEKSISKPLIKKCLSFGEMLREGFMFKQSLQLPKECNENEKNLLYKISNRTFFPISLRSLQSSKELVKLVLNRTDVHSIQLEQGGYCKRPDSVSEEDIEKHLAGSLTLGAYQLDQDSFVKWVCLDIDSHAPKGVIESENDIEARDEKAEKDCERMCNFLQLHNVPYLLEKSGSPHSYHIWIFLKPVEAKKAKYFADSLRKEAGIDCEVFPKQERIYQGKYGNLVKVPLATHQVHKSKSMIQVNGKFITRFENLEIGILDITALEVPERKRAAARPVIETVIPVLPAEVHVKKDVRPCIAAAAKMQLTGDPGNFMRVAMVREYFNSGISEPERLAAMFSNQTDFSYEKSLYHVKRVLDSPSIYIKCETIRYKGGSFVDCSTCSYRRSFLQKVQIAKNPPACIKQPSLNESIT